MRGIPFVADLQTRRHRDRLREALEAEAQKIEAVREVRRVAIAAVEEVKRRMSVLEKLAEVRQRRIDLTKSLDDGAQKLLERYEDAEKKKDLAFLRHNQQLDAEHKQLADLDDAIAMLSNSLGNSSDA